MNRRLVRLTVVALIALVTAGCAGGSAGDDSGVDGATSAGSATSAADTARDKAVRYAECMRDNGVAAFPDPDASGRLTIDSVANAAGLDTSAQAFEEALASCSALEPPGFTGEARTSEQQLAALRFAQCMRENGVADFPDPEPDGPLVDTNRIPSTDREGGMAILDAAMEACGDIIVDQLGNR